eukprot:3626481-Pyramimonas_sp.AAC.1
MAVGLECVLICVPNGCWIGNRAHMCTERLLGIGMRAHVCTKRVLDWNACSYVHQMAVGLECVLIRVPRGSWIGTRVPLHITRDAKGIRHP